MIAETVQTAEALGAEVWLRGGWAMDFFLGAASRDHEDIDWFAWADDATALTGALLLHGWRSVPGSPPEWQLDFVKDGLESSLTLVNRDEAGRVVVAGGPWVGTPWPEGMLEAEPRCIAGVRCAIVSPQVQIEIKRMMPVWDASRPRRLKDAEDIARLEAALRVRERRSEQGGGNRPERSLPHRGAPVQGDAS